jgi:hypothetical protein
LAEEAVTATCTIGDLAPEELYEAKSEPSAQIHIGNAAFSILAPIKILPFPILFLPVKLPRKTEPLPALFCPEYSPPKKP